MDHHPFQKGYLPYDKVDNDPAQEEGSQKSPLVVNLIIIVIVVNMTIMVNMAISVMVMITMMKVHRMIMIKKGKMLMEDTTEVYDSQVP